MRSPEPLQNAEYPQNAVNSQVNKRMIGYYAQVSAALVDRM